ncbi:MAG: TetR/AcrR family transcriptional regulator [Solirubrobacteraceae bacterium]|nr:TetR/AcrR family transcriptional regulator [Solirubrobacteraceae bacterium]
MSSPSTARADARRNRDQILDAAASLLGERPTASIADVAEAAGLGRATVYRHFPDVAAIQQALLEEALGHGKEIVRDRLGADPRPGYCEGSLGDELLKMTRENLPRTSRWTEVLVGEPIQDEELVHTFTPVVAATFRRGQQRGEFRRDVDPDVVADTFVALTVRAGRLVHGRGVDLETAMQPVNVYMDGLRRRR